MPEVMQTMDEAVLRWIGEHLRMDWLDPFMVFYTTLGNGGLIFIATAVILLFFRRTRRAGAAAGVAMTLGLLLTNLIIKPLVSRPRPWVVMDGWQALVTSSDMNSFPSGHTTAAFAFGVALCAALPQKWAKAAALIAAALMGFSRLYVGVHFPSDVLAGALIGTVCGLLGGWITGRFTAWYRSRRAAE